MVECSIRFGITDGEGHRASTWKLWAPIGVNKSNVYLVCRALGGKLKASLHESGRWRIAYTPETFKQEVEGIADKHRDRVIEKWPRPKPIGKGVTLAYRIVTPPSSVTSLIGKTRGDIIWIPNAPIPKATEIDVIITAPNTPTTGWPGKRSMGTSLIGSLKLGNGETVWVVHMAIDMPAPFTATNVSPHFFKGMGPRDLESDNLRALAFGHEKDGSRIIYDLCIVKEPN